MYDGCMRYFIIAIFLALTFWEPIYARYRTPPNTTYTYVHNHSEDYFFHLHVMRQGYEGAWTVIPRMTPEEYPARFATPFFLVLGKLGHVLPLGMGELYTLARVLGAIALMIVIYGLISHLFPDSASRIAAFALTLSGTFLPTLSGDIPVLVRSIWTELDPLMRLSFVPHHLWSKVLMVGLLLLFLKKRSPVLIGILTAIAGFVSPVFLVTYMATLTLWVAVESVLTRTISRTLIVSYFSGLSAGLFVSIYHMWLSKSSFPWTTYGPPWEGNWLYLFPWWMYVQQFGPLLLFAVIGSVKSFRKSPAVRLLTCWVIVGWVFIFVLRPFLPFSNSRYLSGYQWIAVGILAYEGIRRFKHQTLLVVLLLLLSVPSWYLSLQNVVKKVNANVSNPQYVMSNDIEKTLTYVGTLKNCTVAAPDWFSTMIPAYSSCRTVSGHKLMTYANDIKVYEMNEFFFQPKPLSEKEARIKQYRITHVITLDGITGTDMLPLLASTPVFVSGGVRVWETR